MYNHEERPPDPLFFVEEELPADILEKWDYEESLRNQALEHYNKALEAFESHSERDRLTSYVRIPTEVANGLKRLTAAQMTCYAALSYCANNATRIAVYNASSLAAVSDVSVRSLPRLLKTLEDNDLIIRDTKNSFIIPAPITHVRISADALWTSHPQIASKAGSTAKPLLARGSALRTLAGLLLAVNWDTWTVTRSHQSLAKQAGMTLSQYRDGLKILQEIGLVVAHPDVKYKMTEGGVRRQSVPLRIRWSATQAWQTEERKVLSAHARIMRAHIWFRKRNLIPYVQEDGDIARQIQFALKSYSEDVVMSAVIAMTRQYITFSQRSIEIECEKQKEYLSKKASSGAHADSVDRDTVREIMREQKMNGVNWNYNDDEFPY